MTSTFAEFSEYCRGRIDSVMARQLESPAIPAGGLLDALRYALLGGGKRVRPLLAYAGCKALGGDFEDADAAACAVEYIHAYSLIHDDLPALDDADLRRGRPSLHRAFDEATAILTGDALQAMAFEILCRPDSGGDRRQMARELALAVGPAGMVGGQWLDMNASAQAVSGQALETVHRLKTGALIRASVLLGAMSAGVAAPEQLEPLGRYGPRFGARFPDSRRHS